MNPGRVCATTAIFAVLAFGAATSSAWAAGNEPPPAPSTAAAAQTAPSPTATASTLTVVAPRVVRGGAGPAWAQGVKVEVVSLAKPVSFADLDLTTEDGANELRKRIMYAALDACNELEAEYPSYRYLLTPATQNCPDATARTALAIGEQFISAARSHPG